MAAIWSRSNGRCGTIYGVEPGEVFWAASDVGWVVGHSYIVYAPLLHGATTILYEGKPVGTPDAGAFWRVIAEHKVVALFTAPTAFRAIKKEDPRGAAARELRPLAASALCSSPASAPTPTRCMGRDACSACRCSIIGGRPRPAGRSPAIRSGSGCCRSNTARRACRCRATMSRCSTTAASRCSAGTDRRASSIKLPLPPGCLPTLWKHDERFRESYLDDFPGYYKTADAGFIDEDGYVFVMARTDDIINVAGHRLSTGGMEEVLAGHPDVAECAVIGVDDALKGAGALRLRGAEGGRRPRADGDRERDRRSWCATRSARSPPSRSP